MCLNAVPQHLWSRMFNSVGKCSKSIDGVYFADKNPPFFYFSNPDTLLNHLEHIITRLKWISKNKTPTHLILNKNFNILIRSSNVSNQKNENKIHSFWLKKILFHNYYRILTTLLGGQFSYSTECAYLYLKKKYNKTSKT